MIQTGSQQLLLATAAALMARAGLSVVMSTGAELADGVRQAATEGAAEGVRQSFSSSWSSLANEKKTTSSASRNSAVTVGVFIAPFTDSFPSPRSSATCANTPLLEAGYQLVVSDHGREAGSRATLAAAVVRNVNSNRSDLSKPARGTFYESLLSAIDLYEKHYPAYKRQALRARRQGFPLLSLYEVVCRSRLPEKDVEVIESGGGSGSEGGGDDDDDEFDFKLTAFTQHFPGLWSKVACSILASLSHYGFSRLDIFR
ncbi:unnamed protein product [Ectocarpus sp. CCAP 1310/34]|nr:unnamed protein product [Ectocarpus sp. CCAP 1310/34]